MCYLTLPFRVPLVNIPEPGVFTGGRLYYYHEYVERLYWQNGQEMSRHIRPRGRPMEAQAARNSARLLRDGGRMQISWAEELVAGVSDLVRI